MEIEKCNEMFGAYKHPKYWTFYDWIKPNECLYINGYDLSRCMTLKRYLIAWSRILRFKRPLFWLFP